MIGVNRSDLVSFSDADTFLNDYVPSTCWYEGRPTIGKDDVKSQRPSQSALTYPYLTTSTFPLSLCV